MSTNCTAARVLIMAWVVGWLSAATCRAAVDVEAYIGGPLGVAQVTVDLPPDAPTTPRGDDRFALVETNGRVLYPVVDSPSVGRIVRQFLDIPLPNRATFYFLFRGSEPLDVTIYTPTPQSGRIVPEQDREEYRELLDDWWEAVTERYEHVHRQADYPIVVENYVTANWARRLSRRMPEPDPFIFGQRRLGATWLAQLTANEGYQAAIERDLVLGRGGNSERASLPLPTPVAPLPFSFALPSDPRHPHPGPLSATADLRLMGEGIEVEPIAQHVPVECFYMRFGSFTNYLWFRDFLRKWQGDLGNMVVLRSIDRGTSDRLQRQLALRETKIARVMGPTVIRDVAIIGLDAYLRDGAAMGVLFQANNNELLALNINGQRQDAVDRFNHDGGPAAEVAAATGNTPAATLTTVTIADHDVSFLSSPDGRLRSYYATDGEFHLVTTSRRLVVRFYEAGQGGNPLAASADFQMARHNMPLARNDTIFVYMSSALFENLASPQYRVELDRRLRSIGQVRVLKMARLAAAAEGKPAHSVDDLIEAELLPAGFGQRADGSTLVEDESGFRDSLRGVPGRLVPIPDVPVASITPAEAARYEEFQTLVDQQVGRFVPVVAAIRREEKKGISSIYRNGPEGASHELNLSPFSVRITTDVRLAPYSETRLAKWAEMLGPAETLRVAPLEGDVAAAEVVWPGLGEPIHLFGGLRDFRTPLVVRQGVGSSSPLSLWSEIRRAGERAEVSVPAEYLRGYIGAWPRPHLLDRWLGAPSGPPDAEGNVHYGLFNLWRRQAGDFFLFSFKQDVLMEVGPQLAMVEAERPAQVRVRLADPSDKEVATGVSGLGYMRARQTSASATRFMNSLASQLHVPPPGCRQVAEQLVGGRFVCPLGGEYVLVDASGGTEGMSGSWGRGAAEPPGGATGGGVPSGSASANGPAGATAGLSSSATGGEPASSTGRLLWASTANAPVNQFLLTEIPADYQMPLMEWFRGATCEVARMNDAVTLHAEVDMVHQDVGPPADDSGNGLHLPNIGDLLGGWTKPSGQQEVLPEPALPEPILPSPALDLPPPEGQPSR